MFRGGRNKIAEMIYGGSWSAVSKMTITKAICGLWAMFPGLKHDSTRDMGCALGGNEKKSSGLIVGADGSTSLQKDDLLKLWGLCGGVLGPK